MSIHSSGFLEKKRRLYRKRIAITLTLVLGFVGISSYLTHMESFLIREIRVEGNSVTSDEEINNVVWEALDGKYLWLFPKANMVIYPSRQIKKNLLSEIPRLQEIGLELGDERYLDVIVKERTPYALYCEDVTSISDPAGCYFLDDQGFIFSHAPSFSGDVYFLYSSEVPIEKPLGKEFLPAQDFVRASQLIESMDKYNVDPRAFETVSNKGEYHLILPGSGRIIWKSSEEFDKVARNLEAFIQDEKIVGQENFFNRILYIDLRFENKVFYKFQE